MLKIKNASLFKVLTKIFTSNIVTFGTATILSCFYASSYAASSSPLGYWKTIDDVSGAAKSIVLLEEKNNKISAKVIKILKLDEPGDPETKTCDKCPGKRKGQRIKGMTFMWDVTKDEDSDSWSGGKILDPKTGSVYKVTLSLEDDGSKLNVRGYIGISLLGRTQVWERTSAPKDTEATRHTESATPKLKSESKK